MNWTPQEEAKLDDPTLSAWEKFKLQLLFGARFLYDNLVLVASVTLLGMAFLAISLWTRWESEYTFIERLLDTGL